MGRAAAPGAPPNAAALDAEAAVAKEAAAWGDVMLLGDHVVRVCLVGARGLLVASPVTVCVICRFSAWWGLYIVCSYMII